MLVKKLNILIPKKKKLISINILYDIIKWKIFLFFFTFNCYHIFSTYLCIGTIYIYIYIFTFTNVNLLRYKTVIIVVSCQIKYKNILFPS